MRFAAATWLVDKQVSDDYFSRRVHDWACAMNMHICDDQTEARVDHTDLIPDIIAAPSNKHKLTVQGARKEGNSTFLRATGTTLKRSADAARFRKKCANADAPDTFTENT